MLEWCHCESERPDSPRMCDPGAGPLLPLVPAQARRHEARCRLAVAAGRPAHSRTTAAAREPAVARGVRDRRAAPRRDRPCRRRTDRRDRDRDPHARSTRDRRRNQRCPAARHGGDRAWRRRRSHPHGRRAVQPAREGLLGYCSTRSTRRHRGRPRGSWPSTAIDSSTGSSGSHPARSPRRRSIRSGRSSPPASAAPIPSPDSRRIAFDATRTTPGPALGCPTWLPPSSSRVPRPSCCRR